MKVKRIKRWTVGGAVGAVMLFGGHAAAADYPPERHDGDHGRRRRRVRASPRRPRRPSAARPTGGDAGGHRARTATRRSSSPAARSSPVRDSLVAAKLRRRPASQPDHPSARPAMNGGRRARSARSPRSRSPPGVVADVRAAGADRQHHDRRRPRRRRASALIVAHRRAGARGGPSPSPPARRWPSPSIRCSCVVALRRPRPRAVGRRDPPDEPRPARRRRSA